MPKKYFVAREPILFNSLSELIAYIDGFKEQNISGLVVGSYLGELKIDANFVLQNDSKVKRLKVKPELVAKAEKMGAALPPPLEIDPVEDEEASPVGIPCSFCIKAKVKTVLFDGIPIHLCENHLHVEKEMYAGK